MTSFKIGLAGPAIPRDKRTKQQLPGCGLSDFEVFCVEHHLMQQNRTHFFSGER